MNSFIVSPTTLAKRVWFKSIVDGLLNTGFNKTSLAEKLRISPQRLTNLLNGSDAVSDKVIDNIVEALGLGNVIIKTSKALETKHTTELFNALQDVAHDIEKGFDIQARQKLAAITNDLVEKPYEDTAAALPSDAEKAADEYAFRRLAVVAPEMARSNYSRRIKESQIHFCASDLAQAFLSGWEHREKALWHPGTEKPQVEDGAGDLFVVIPSVQCDLDAFFCFYNNGEPEPWGVVVLDGEHPYNLHLRHDEVERWAPFDELMNIKRNK